ncbi:MAG: tetratricopeptide repeat protein, partial [Candidatus Aminicenantes bacterium]
QVEKIQKKLSHSQKPSDSVVKAALKRTIEKQKKDWWFIELVASSLTDPDRKEEIYLEGLKEFPGSAELTGNYALFLHVIRKDYDKAEKLYKKSLELDPQNASNTGKYALFLHVIRKDYDRAEELYKKSLELDPKNAHSRGNYAQMLLARGDKKQGEKYLEKASSLNPSDDEVLLLEMWFYKYAHFPHRFKQADKEIIKLLNKGVRSPGWDLSPNIERAKLDGHPAPDRLEKLAKIITGDASLDTLE